MYSPVVQSPVTLVSPSSRWVSRCVMLGVLLRTILLSGSQHRLRDYEFDTTIMTYDLVGGYLGDLVEEIPPVLIQFALGVVAVAI